MYISDIQKVKQEFDDSVKITFANSETNDDCMEIILGKVDISVIVDFFKKNLSYGAELKQRR